MSLPQSGSAPSIHSGIRARWPKVRIVLRGDSGFCREELMAWCEAEGVAYLFGLAPNARLKAVLVRERRAQRNHGHVGKEFGEHDVEPDVECRMAG